MNKLALETEYSELEWDIVETGEAVIAYLGWINGCETPMMNALDYDFPVDNLIRGIGAALHDCHEGDEQSLELQKKIEEQGVMETARALTGIGNQRILARIVRAYATIEEEIR